MKWIRFIEAYDSSLPSLSLGNPRVFHTTPEWQALIGEDDQPQLVLHLHPNTGAFREAVVWKDWVVVGVGDEVYWVGTDTHENQSYSLEGYFGHLYPLEDFLLVASASALWCFNAARKLCWHMNGLGMDGVLVHNVANDIIEGEGEWDPPEGWQPFCINLLSGEKI